MYIVAVASICFIESMPLRLWLTRVVAQILEHGVSLLCCAVDLGTWDSAFKDDKSNMYEYLHVAMSIYD